MKMRNPSVVLHVNQNGLVLSTAVVVSYVDVFHMERGVAIHYRRGPKFREAQRWELARDNFPSPEELVKYLNAAGIGLHVTHDQNKTTYYNALDNTYKTALLKIHVKRGQVL